jgi:hypothetical protein
MTGLGAEPSFAVASEWLHSAEPGHVGGAVGGCQELCLTTTYSAKGDNLIDKLEITTVKAG